MSMEREATYLIAFLTKHKRGLGSTFEQVSLIMGEIYYKIVVVDTYIGDDVRRAVAANRRQRIMSCANDKSLETNLSKW